MFKSNGKKKQRKICILFCAAGVVKWLNDFDKNSTGKFTEENTTETIKLTCSVEILAKIV